MNCPESTEFDQPREAQLTAFQRELEHRLQSLDRGEHSDPSAVRRRIEKKSQARRRANP